MDSRVEPRGVKHSGPSVIGRDPLEMREEAYWWLALGMVPGVGSATYLRLLKRFGTPEAVFRAPLEELVDVQKVGEKVAKAIVAFDEFDRVEDELHRMKELGVRLVFFGHEGYPANLATIADPPPYLYVKGRWGPEDNIAVAIVGSRSASQYGLRVTHRIARELASEGITIISGMARGIDSEAHKGALAAGGKTMAVLGSGINVIYPPENKDLYYKIADRGAIFSEYPLDAGPDAAHFPMRNRIISGLSLGVVVVEAAAKSGSLITAHMALEQGREVFAVPGSVDSMRSRGTHNLIRQGAHLVESARDVVDVLAPMLKAWSKRSALEENLHTPEEGLSSDEQKVLSTIGQEPKHIDSVIKESRLDVSSASSILLNLELKGRVRQLPGKFFVRQ